MLSGLVGLDKTKNPFALENTKRPPAVYDPQAGAWLMIIVHPNLAHKYTNRRGRMSFDSGSSVLYSCK